jgi:hypothetical protein
MHTGNGVHSLIRLVKAVRKKRGNRMSMGAETRQGEDFKTKKAFKEAVANDPKSFRLFDTSLFDPEPDHNGETLPIGKRFEVVGPNVYRDRRWYATIEKKADGTVTVK